MGCVFCHRDEGYICSSCFQRLLQSPQSQIKAAYFKAVEAGHEDKVKILKTIIEDQEHGPDHTPECVNGKRPLRTARYEQRANWGFKERKRPSFYQAGPEKQAVF